MNGQLSRVLELKKLQSDEKKDTAKNIFSFTSGKGGTGKTFLSLNIAYYLSLQKKKILFIDLDTNLSNVNIMLNYIASKTLNDFFSGKKELSGTITKISENLHFIFGDSGNTANKFVYNIDDFFNHLSGISSEYDYVFLDTSAGAGEDILGILLNSNHSIIITTPEPTAVMDAYVMLKLLKKNNYKGFPSVVINKCSSSEEGELTFNNLNSAVSHFLGEEIKLLGFVNLEDKVRKSIMNQELFLKNHNNTTAENQIISLANKVAQSNILANIKQV